jgi:Holliday junction DNA helicase RuvA
VIVTLEGRLEYRTSLSCVIEIQGIGYEVAVPLMANLPEIGERVKLWIYAIYREDSRSLYGFNNLEERDFFKLVVEKVYGIGPKIALAMLSKFRLSELHQAIAEKDTAMLANIPGIGKKTAEKIALELSDKINRFEKNSMVSDGRNNVRNDAVLGLIALGYRKQDAEAMIHNMVRQNPDVDAEELIRRAIIVR